MPRKLLSNEEIKLKPFTTHGLEFIGMSGNDHQADCPFCGKSRSFHVDPDTTKWVCSSGLDRCGRTGNYTTFVRQWAAFCFESTSEAQWAALSRLRDGLPAKCFKRWGVGFNPLTQEWLIPNHNPDGEYHDVRRWKPKRSPMGSPGVSAGLWGAHQLHDPDKADWPVWICEGEFDGMAMWLWCLLAGRKVVVVAVPGCNVFKDEWIPWFKGRDVTFWYDRDASGAGYSWKKGKLLYNTAASIKWHFWDEELPDKYDVRDWFCDRVVRQELDPAAELAYQCEWVWDTHPMAEEDAEAPTAAKAPRQRPPTNPDIEETLSIYGKSMNMTRDLRDATKVLYAVCLSQQLKLDVPAWTFLVAPPSSGKTRLLMALHKVPEVSYHSNVTAKALVSGFKESAKEDDPSVLKKLIDAGVGVFKDFTQLLGRSNEMELQAVMRLLRGAFDGEAEQHFGNGVVRKYKGFFTLIAGVTDEIHAYSEATVGERFLKYELLPLSKKKDKALINDIIYGSVSREKEYNEMEDAALAFLDRDMPLKDPRELLPQMFADRINGLSRLIVKLRHAVSWERDFGYDKVLRFRPKEEKAYRVARQLTAIALSLCEVDGVRRYGHEQHRLVERVAFDTAIGFNLDIVEGMMGMGNGIAIPQSELVETVRIPRSTLQRRIEDMLVTGLISPSAKQPVATSVGRKPEYFDVNQELREIWKEAAPGESHIESAIAAREGRKVKDV